MAKRKIIVIDESMCNGCGDCIIACQEKALQIVNGKARLVKDQYCDGLGACLGKCPQDAISIVEREADAFDEHAVEQHIQESVKHHAACGCPSAKVISFTPQTPRRPETSGPAQSALRHWPVQLNLVPPDAPFLRGSNLLIAADCVPVAYGDFHGGLLAGKTVVMGCPKFDDTQYYQEKITDIFRHAGLSSVTVAVMEVPCCSALDRIVREAYASSGAVFPLKTVVIGVNGTMKQ